jgi:tRNA dimethylallyltransferase
MEVKPALLLAGPTAVGKSEVALCLAEKLGGEIVSVDSMQVYHGLDIGTAKPSVEDRARVPHHLLDVVELTETFDAALFARLATDAVAEIRRRGRVPILCGGTGLYFKAFLQGLGEAPPADEQLRSELEARPLAELLNELSVRDPITYQAIDRQNRRRVVRALEVVRLTNQPFSAQRAKWRPTGDMPQNPFFFGLSRMAADLHRRIDTRVDDMFQRGLVAETASLLNHGLAQNRTALQALGYRQVVEHLENKRSLAETIALVKTRTRQFAKRQMTWFRRQFHMNWIMLEPTTELDAVADRILERW